MRGDRYDLKTTIETEKEFIDGLGSHNDKTMGQVNRLTALFGYRDALSMPSTVHTEEEVQELHRYVEASIEEEIKCSES
jgi:hypothetical protein